MATPSEPELARYAPGQKLILHYTPPQIRPTQTELAGHDQIASDCASSKALAQSNSVPETRFEGQHLDNAESLTNVTEEVGQSCSAVTFSDSSEGGACHHLSSHTDNKFKTQLGQSCKRDLRGSPKYTATILDATTQHERAFKHACAVFIVPQVRSTNPNDHDWSELLSPSCEELAQRPKVDCLPEYRGSEVQEWKLQQVLLPF